MCGIAGYINLNKTNFYVDDGLLQKMQQAMVHRGPDDSGIWKSNEHGIGFAHRRLSIIDLSKAGHQPMIDRERTVVICYNGEVYNHRLLRKELEWLGYSYSSNTDTETLLYAYKEWGIDFIHKIEGMFAIAIFDLKKDELYLIRDRIGIKPLYFSVQDGVLSFASEIKAIWQLPWNKKEINEQALYHYLTYLVTPAPMTLYKNVYKLPSGFYAKVDASRRLSFREWYSPVVGLDASEKEKINDENYCKDKLKHLLRESIKKRMMADVPVGVFLSGGIDSSLNVALMSEFASKIKTFNVVFSDGLEFDERRWAKKIANKFGTDHHEIVISEKQAFDAWEKIVYHQDEPLADWVCIPLYFVAKLAAEQGVKVVQIGEGSDELFCGYGSYANLLNLYKKWWHPTQKFTPNVFRKFIHFVLSNGHKKFKHIDYVKNWAMDRNLFWGGAIAFKEARKQDLFKAGCFAGQDAIVDQIYSGLNQNFDSYNVVDYHLGKLKKIDSNADFLKSMIYLEFKNRLPELLLMRADKMTMAHSLEGRVPFLDHKLVEFALQIPSHLKYKDGQTKYILKKVCEDILPKDVIYRKKVGFAAPAAKWLREGEFFKPYFEKQLQSKRWDKFLNYSHIQKMYGQHLNQSMDLSPQLWVLNNLFTTKI